MINNEHDPRILQLVLTLMKRQAKFFSKGNVPFEKKKWMRVPLAGLLFWLDSQVSATMWGPHLSGNYALWSKTLRAIKHLDCRDVRALHKNKDDKSALIEETGTAVTPSNCFICGARFNLYRSSLEPDYYRIGSIP